HHDGDVVLGVVRGGAEMRQRVDPGVAEQLGAGKIGHIPLQPVAVQPLHDRVIGDDAFTRKIEQHGAGAEVVDILCVDHVARLLAERDVQRDEMALLEHFVAAGGLAHLRRQAPRRIDGDVRVVAEHVHAQADRRIGDQAADLAQADDPSVCPGSSEPANCFLPSSTCSSNSEEVLKPRTKSKAGGRLRAARSMPASTSSFTALAFAPGALNTGTPRLDSVLTGMLFTPAPARPTASREGPNSCRCRSAERTRMACGSFASFTTA